MKNFNRFLMVAMLAAVFCLPVSIARADLQAYDPDSVSVLITSTTVLAADNRMLVLQLTNNGAYDVWLCRLDKTPVVGKGFYLPVGSTITFSGTSCPQQGLKGIADGGTCLVAIGKG